MTEAQQRQQDSPLRSDRGATTIKDTVVSKIAGMAAGEVEGVHMGGNASRSAGGLLGDLTGSESTTRGVSVEVGSVETAIDLKMGIDYGKNILGTVGEVRQKITERVQNITGLKITELNVTISDITFPEDGGRDGGEGERNEPAASSGSDFETRTAPRRELRPGAGERETTEVEPDRRAYTEGSSGPEEEVRAEGTPVEEDETRTLRVGDEETGGDDRPAAEGRDEEEAERETETPTSRDEVVETSASDAGTTEVSGTETSAGDEEDRTQEIDRDRVAEAEERRARRRRRREERGDS